MLDKIKIFSNFWNKVYLAKDILTVNIKPDSYPRSILISLSNLCNLSCPICSVNNLKNSKIKRVVNNISLEQFKAFDEVLKRADNIGFIGFIGEFILNPEFSSIIRFLKSNYKISLYTSTNGMGINKEIQDAMLEAGFDSINFSLHAATPETYKILQGGNFNTVINNLTGFQKEKKKNDLSKPSIIVVYALNKTNIQETKQMIDLVTGLDISHLYIYHYRDYGLNTISLDKDPDYANKMIDEIYSYAKEKNVLSVLPKNRPYYKECEFEKSEEIKKEIKCYLPWTGLEMKASYSHKDSYYLGCCNTFNPFLFNYKEHIDKYGKVCFEEIWHHPVFQYLRETVNTTLQRGRNPLCRYCKSKKRDYLKNTDNKKNYEIKLSVIDEFFEDFSKKYKVDREVEGLKILYTEDEELSAMANYI